MMEQLILLDYKLFYLINIKYSNPAFDILMVLFRNKYFWAPVYMFIAAFVVFNFKKDRLWILLFLLLTVLLCDQLSAHVIKPIFERLRPCNNPYIGKLVRLLVNCGSGYSFVSAHATNHFGIAVFLSYTLMKKNVLIWVITLSWAALICYAQIYVGVHFPLDMICGGILGCILGYISAKLCEKVIQKEIYSL